MKLRITRVDKEMPMPEYKTAGSVAFDLYSRVDAKLGPGEKRILPSNFIVEVPEGYFLMVSARSSTPHKGLLLPNSIGVIDQDYRGPEDEIGIFVYNYTTEPVQITRGDRIAQAILIPIMKVEFEETEGSAAPSRGGFGSTGMYGIG